MIGNCGSYRGGWTSGGWPVADAAHDTVNHPPHYNTGGIEVIEAIEAWGLGFHLGNAVKYIARANHKGSRLEDLRKARWYLDREIERSGEVADG